MLLRLIEKYEFENIDELLTQLNDSKLQVKYNEKYLKKAEKDGISDVDIMDEIVSENLKPNKAIDIDWLDECDHYTIIIWEVIPENIKILKAFYKKWFLKLRLRGY